MELTPLGLRKITRNDHIDFLIFISENMDLIDSVLSKKQSKIYEQPTEPTTPNDKDLWIDTSVRPFTIKMYDVSSWELVGGTSTGTSGNVVTDSNTNGNILIDGVETNIYTHPANHPATIITEDSTHRFATDAEKNSWNSKADASATISALNSKVDAVLGKILSTNDYTNAEKAKLTSISDSAKNVSASGTNGNILIDNVETVTYSHPATHPASIITDDATHRFSTDTEKATWNAKQDASQKGLPNGFAGLDNSAKIPTNQLPDSILGQLSYKGLWDASTNTPALPTASTSNGFFYIASVSGTYNSISFLSGDWAICNGVTWEKKVNDNTINTVFGRSGNVTANAGDYDWSQITKTTSSIADLTTRNASDITTDATHRFSTDAEKAIWNSKVTILEQSTAPTSPVTNDLWIDTSVTPRLLKIYSGSLWNIVGGTSGSGTTTSEPEYVVKDAWTTTGTRTLPAGTFYKFYIDNTGTDDLTFTINGMTFTVKSKEELEETFDAFTQVTITATSTFDANASGLKSGSTTPTYSVKYYFSGSINTIRSFSDNVYGIVISNDGLSALTYTVNGITLIVEAGDVVEKYFDALTEVAIISTVAYRAYVKSTLNTVITGSNVADTTAPTDVATITPSNVTATSLTLSWTASPSTDIASYDIYNGVTLLGNSVTTSFNVTGLTEKTQYTFYVKSKDTSDNVSFGTPYTTTTADVTAPANASGLTAVNITKTTLTLNWTASTSSDVASYDVYNGASLLANVTATTYNVIGLTSGTNYTFNVKAKDASNNASGSATVSTITIPSDVTGLTTSNVTSTSLTVNWFASTGAATYDVYNGATLLGNTTTNSFNVSGLTANTQYTFKVIAKNTSGTSIGTTTIVTTSATTVNPVSNLTAPTATINSVVVNWIGSTSTIANQEVAYSTDGTNYSAPVTIASNVTSYTFTGLSAGINYTLRVVAVDASANHSVPATVQKATAVSVSYTASASIPTGTYGSTQNVVLSCTPTGATIYYTTNGATPTTSSSVYSTTILVSATTTLKFFAQDSVGNLTTVQTANYTIDTVAPTPVDTFTAGTSTSNTIPVSWTKADLTDVANYEVAYSTDNFVSNTVIASSVVNSSSTFYTVTGLTIGTLYTVRVVAIDGAGNRSTGATAQATTTNVSMALSMNGTSDYVSLPSLNFDRIDVDCCYDNANAGGCPVWSADFNANFFVVGSYGTNIVYPYFDGNAVTLASNFPKNTRSVLRTDLKTAITKTNNIFARYDGTSNFTKGYVYKITCYISGSIVALYDLTTQFSGTTLVDSSGHGSPSATLHGGTWVTQPFVVQATPSSKVFNSTQSVTLVPSDNTATLYYTTDGTPPTTSSPVYSTAISLATTTTLRVLPVISGVSQPIELFSYTKDTSAPITQTYPNPNAGTFTSSINLSFETNEISTIYYTLDSSTPTTSSSIYISTSPPVALSATTTVKYFAKDLAGNSGSVQTAIFTINTGATSNAISFSGIGEFIKLPSMTFDAIEITCLVNTNAMRSTNYLDARSGVTNGYVARGIDSKDTINAGISVMYKDSVQVSTNTLNLASNTKAVLKFSLASTGTDDVNIFSDNSSTSNTMQGDIYDVKVYNAASVIAHYDFTTKFVGTSITDISGNGKTATLTGGTWVVAP